MESEVMYTLNTTEVHAVCYVKSRNATSKDDYETWVESDTMRTLKNVEGATDGRCTCCVVEVADETDNLT